MGLKVERLGHFNEADKRLYINYFNGVFYSLAVNFTFFCMSMVLYIYWWLQFVVCSMNFFRRQNFTNKIYIIKKEIFFRKIVFDFEKFSGEFENLVRIKFAKNTLKSSDQIYSKNFLLAYLLKINKNYFSYITDLQTPLKIF